MQAGSVVSSSRQFLYRAGAARPSGAAPAYPCRVTGPPDFLVHREGDHVGVAVQDVTPGRRRGVHLDSERELEVELVESVPLGHKVALIDLAEDAEVIEYGLPIGRARRPVRTGQLVHVHNLASARWPARA